MSTVRMLSSLPMLEKYVQQKEHVPDTPRYKLSKQLLDFLLEENRKAFFNFPFLRKLLVTAFEVNKKLEKDLERQGLFQKHLINIGTMLIPFSPNLLEHMNTAKVDGDIPPMIDNTIGSELHDIIKKTHENIIQEEKKVESSIEKISSHLHRPLAEIVGDYLAARVRNNIRK